MDSDDKVYAIGWVCMTFMVIGLIAGVVSCNVIKDKQEKELEATRFKEGYVQVMVPSTVTTPQTYFTPIWVKTNKSITLEKQ